MLSGVPVRRSQVLPGGGGRSRITWSIDGAFDERGWIEKKWSTKIVVDDNVIESPTYQADCYRNSVAIEIE
ncbi:MAG: hypothetical protein AMXMBFR83_18490 [Phycisphaerae bacterium]